MFVGKLNKKHNTRKGPRLGELFSPLSPGSGEEKGDGGCGDPPGGPQLQQGLFHHWCPAWASVLLLWQLDHLLEVISTPRNGGHHCRPDVLGEGGWNQPGTRWPSILRASTPAPSTALLQLVHSCHLPSCCGSTVPGSPPESAPLLYSSSGSLWAQVTGWPRSPTILSSSGVGGICACKDRQLSLRGTRQGPVPFQLSEDFGRADPGGGLLWTG